MSMTILGENYNEVWGFDCDDYDAFDPFATAEADTDEDLIRGYEEVTAEQ